MAEPIYVCKHCSGQYGVKKDFCRWCDTAEKRAEMDKNNKEHFKQNNLEYHCDYCEKIIK